MMSKAGFKVFVALFGVVLMMCGCSETQQISNSMNDTVKTGELKAETAESVKTVPDKTSIAVTETPKDIVKPVQTSLTSTTVLVKSEDPDRPILFLEQPVHDFGDIGPKSKNTCQFKFVNKGKKPLIITQKPRSTCGCSLPTLIKDGKRYRMVTKDKPLVFEQGESGEMEVTYTAGSYKSKVSKNLYILSNDPEMPSAEVTVKANIVVNVDVFPDKFDLAINKPNAGMGKLIVKSSDGIAFKIKSIGVSGNCMTIDFDPEKSATEFVLNPVVDMEKLRKSLNGSITINVDHPKAGMLISRFTTKPEYTLRRPTIILQNLMPGREYIKDNRLMSNYDKTIEVESITSRDGFAQVIDSNTQLDGKVLDFKIKVVTPEVNQSKRRLFTDELTIKLKDGTEMKVRVNGWYKLR